jgi:flagellar biogenesis protein FliO
MTAEALAFQQTPIITAGYIFQVFFSLAIVLAFIFLIAKYVLPKLKITANGKLINVLDRVYLEPQVTAYILKVGRDAWLVVASNKQIAKIDKVNIES